MKRTSSNLGIDLPIRPFTQEEIDATFEELSRGGEVNYEAAAREQVWKKEVINALTQYHSSMIDLERRVIGLAAESLTITADDLSTSTTSGGTSWKSATDDLLTMNSQTATQFDYRDFWKIGRFLISPGKGVPPHAIIPALDIEYPGLMPNKEALYAHGAVQLQLVEWDTDDSRWEAKSWGVGWRVWAWQYGPQGVFE